MRKIISLFIVLSMLIAVIPSVTAAEAYDEEVLLKQQEILKALDLMSTDSYGILDNEKEITRVEFASTIGKILDINPTVLADSTYYADVAADSWATHTLNNLVEMGMLTVPDDRIFRPNDVITFEEATKIIVCLLGYSDYAQQLGGFPGGYLAVANRLDLLDGVIVTPTITNAILTPLLYNTVHTKTLEIEKLGKTVTYTNKNEDTLLSLYKNIYIDEGIVEAVNGLTLIGKTVGADRCSIGGNIYNVGKVSALNMLGYNVTVYYKDLSNGQRELVYLDAEDTETLNIRAEDFNGYKDGKISYFDSNDKVKSESIDSSATVVYNGSVVEKSLDSAFDINEGEIRLINNDSDGAYDIVFIENYMTAVVKSISNIDNLIIDDIKSKNVIDLSKIDEDSIWVYSASGALMGMSAIVAGSVIDAAVSENGAIIYVSSDVFDGTVESINLKDKTVTIDGMDYEYLPESFNRYSINVGKSGTFKTNRYGKIAYFSETQSAFLRGYIIDIAKENNGLDTGVKLKMITQDGEIKIFEVADHVEIDMETIKSKVYETLLPAKRGAIMYTLNSKGKISAIDTPTVNTAAGEDDATLHHMGNTALDITDQRFNLEEKKFGKKYYLSSDVTLFRVPTSGEGEDYQYGVDNINNIAGNRCYETMIYKTGHSAECTIVVMKRTAYPMDDYASYYWVKDVRRGVSSEGDPVTKVIVYERGAEKTINIVDGYDIIPSKGDIIRVGVDAKGIGGLVEEHYVYKTRQTGRIDPDSSWKGYDTVNYWYKFVDLQNYNRIAIGSAVTVNGELLGFTREEKGSEEVGEYFKVTASVPVIVYDEKEDVFYQGSLGDIRPSDTYGNDCSELIVYTRYGKVLSVFVMNNRK